jgi:MFS family permease
MSLRLVTDRFFARLQQHRHRGAGILLLLARLLQGLSVGGEYGTSATYLSEVATEKRRGFYSSFQYVTLIGGQLIALGLQLIFKIFSSPTSKCMNGAGGYHSFWGPFCHW